MAVDQKMGSAPPLFERGAFMASITGTTLALAANFVNATSGTAFAMRFSAPIAQSSGALTVYAFMTTKTGSPTAIKAAIFAGPSGAMDDDRPSTDAALATSAAVDVSAQTNNTWTQFDLTGLTLVAGNTYWLVIFNDTGTPASNNATYMTRGGVSCVAIGRFLAYTTADGFTTDPSLVSAANDAPAVLVFDDGSIVGTPYTVGTAHANNANDRGNRYLFDADVVVTGVFNAQLASATLTGFKVYQGAAEVASVTADKNVVNNGNQAVYFDSPVTFESGLAYDVVAKFSGNSTVGTRFNAGDALGTVPADVTNCMPSGVSYVDGATPGSYSEVDGICGLFILVNNIPAAAGGGETSHCFIG